MTEVNEKGDGKKTNGTVIEGVKIISKTGYRIQICFDRDKSIVEKARAKFSMHFLSGLFMDGTFY